MSRFPFSNTVQYNSHDVTVDDVTVDDVTVDDVTVDDSILMKQRPIHQQIADIIEYADFYDGYESEDDNFITNIVRDRYLNNVLFTQFGKKNLLVCYDSSKLKALKEGVEGREDELTSCHSNIQSFTHALENHLKVHQEDNNDRCNKSIVILGSHGKGNINMFIS